ncbi:hypothetical protein [Phormidesmis priestleyi]
MAKAFGFYARNSDVAQLRDDFVFCFVLGALKSKSESVLDDSQGIRECVREVVVNPRSSKYSVIQNLIRLSVICVTVSCGHQRPEAVILQYLTPSD